MMVMDRTQSQRLLDRSARGNPTATVTDGGERNLELTFWGSRTNSSTVRPRRRTKVLFEISCRMAASALANASCS
jgi:hypothetical protein